MIWGKSWTAEGIYLLRRTKINDFSIEGVHLEEIEIMGTGEFQSLLIPVREAVPVMSSSLRFFPPLSNLGKVYRP